MCPFSDKIIASLWVFLKLLKTISNITSIGTLKNIPLRPQILPIKLRVINIIKGLKLSDLPMSFGSRRLPIITWVIVNKMNIEKLSNMFKFWIIEKQKGIVMDKREPINGIKFNNNEKIPKKTAKSDL